jgi:hypothetical protein
VVRLLREHFVAFALNNAGWTMNMTPAEAAWLQGRGGRACTQGMAVLTAGGKVLGTGGGYTPEPNLKMLRDALRKYEPEETVDIGDPAAAVGPGEVPEGWRPFLPRVVPRPAKGGMVLFVAWKAVGLPERPKALPKNLRLADYQRGRKELLVDRIWAGKAEADALAAGGVPALLKRRLAAHVGYVMGSKVKSMTLALHGERLSGSFLLENGERCAALGLVAAGGGRVRRFELIVKGRTTGKADGSGFPSLGALLPEGEKTAAAVAFLLADPGDELARVQPGSRDLGGGEEKQQARRREPPLTAKRARDALLNRMRSEDFFGFDPGEWAKEPVREERDGWYGFGGVFRLNPSARRYTLVIRPRPGVKACTFFFEGTFCLQRGKWMAAAPKQVRSALGGGKPH